MLPIEVFETVIDQARDETASLQHLSLTCRTFLPRSRCHLFHSVVIRTVKKVQSSREFLNSCPWVLPLVRDVTLSLEFTTFGSPNVYLHGSVAVDLLSWLPNLRAWRMTLDSYTTDRRSALSLHRSTLSFYRRYGSSIQDLELSGITFYSISDFIGLVSELTGIQRLICSKLRFQTETGPNPTLYGSGTTMLFRPLRIRDLHVNQLADDRAVEYLLSSSAATLNYLRLDIHYPYGAHERFSDRIAELVGQLSHLSSLTVSIWCWCIGVNEDMSDGWSLSPDIRCACRIFQRVPKARLRDVRVEFELDTIAALGSYLSWGGAPLEACKALEEALLTFPLHRILLRNPIRKRRVGRAAFWSPVIKHAFPILSEQSLLMFTDDKGEAPDLPGHEDEVTCLVASHDSKRIVTASSDGTIIIWDASRGTVLKEWLAHEDAVYALALSPDGQRLVSSSTLNTIEALAVWDISNLNDVRSVTTFEEAYGVTSCTWSPDGTLIASGSEIGTMWVWDSCTFRQCGMLDESAMFGPRLLRFSPDSLYLAWVFDTVLVEKYSKRNDGCVIWRPLMDNPPIRLILPPSPRVTPINALEFSPESRRLATSHGDIEGEPEDFVVRIWDVETGTALALLAGHLERVVDVSFSPDGRSVLSTARDGVKIWDAESYQERTTGTFVPHGQEWTSMARFSPDMRYIAIVCRQTVVLCSRSNFSSVTEFFEHTVSVYHLAFSPNGEFLASGDREGIVYIRSLSYLDH